MKRIKNMKKSTVISIAVMLIFTLTLTTSVVNFRWSGAATNKKTVAKVKKPARVKTLKKVKVGTKWDGRKNVSYAKIKFSKVKGASGYQVLVYRTARTGALTPLVYAYNTKKTTYTVKNLVPAIRYTIKVRAYKKYKNGKVVYGNTKGLRIATPGERKGCYYTCNGCHACVPNCNLLGRHTRDAYKIHKEVHAGYTFWER